MSVPLQSNVIILALLYRLAVEIRESSNYQAPTLEVLQLNMYVMVFHQWKGPSTLRLKKPMKTTES